MSTTLRRAPDDIGWEVPPGILLHGPRHAEPGSDEGPFDATRRERPTYLHPDVVAATAAGYAWFLLVFWVVLGSDGYLGLALFVATMISAVMLGLLVVCGAGGRNVAPWQRHWRSFREFLDGTVEVWGARMAGREAAIQLIGMAWCLAALATAFGIIIWLAQR